jgi:beta-glucanase (GH16 family)
LIRTKLTIPFLLTASLLGAFFVPAAAASAATGTEIVLAPKSAGWSYHRGTSAPAADWKTSTASWRTGTAPLGFGVNTGGLGTRISNDFTTKPLATYFTKSFELGQVPPAGLALEARVDDGIVVFVNGKEVTRANLPSGTIGHGTYATRAPQSTYAAANPVRATVPASALVVGRNVISVQVQSNWRLTHNITFDAKLTSATATATATGTGAEPVTAPDSGAVAGWGTPTWRDEFTHRDSAGRPVIDPAKWNVRDRSDLGLLNDAAVPTAGQVSVDETGIAHLKADWLTTPVIRPSGQSGPTELWHKTGYMDQRSLNSDDMSYSQRYGRWEIRAQVPTGPKTYGALAAFWLRNSNSGEIDVLEAWGYNDVAAPGGQRIESGTTTIHTKTSGSGNEKYYWTHSDVGAATPVWDGFHTYAFELMPTYAAMYVDDVKVMTATPASHPNLWNTAYFGSPLHVRLNLHVGPSAQYWGIPDPDHKEWTKPLDFKVDYVRIWKYTP